MLEAKEELKKIALDTFGTNDGIKPRFPRTGEKIQEVMEASFEAGMKKVAELCLNAIAAEPEFPTDMPDEVWLELNGNRENTSRAMRGSVRLTKKGITERLQAQLKDWGLA